MNIVTAKSLKNTDGWREEIDSPVWQSEAYPLTDLIDGSEALNKTYFKIAYTENSLAIRFKCYYRGELISRYKNYNDPVYRGEVVEFFISAYGDLKDYYEFDLSPFNVLYSARINNIDNYYVNASPISECGVLTCTTIKKHFYEASVMIPFSLLVNVANMEKCKELPWIFNTYRTDRSEGGKKMYAFSPSGKPTYHAADTFGEIIFR